MPIYTSTSLSATSMNGRCISTISFARASFSGVTSNSSAIKRRASFSPFSAISSRSSRVGRIPVRLPHGSLASLYTLPSARNTDIFMQRLR